MAENETDHFRELDKRIQTLEETVELVCRPSAQALNAERIIAIERSTYEANLRIAALEAEIAEIRGRTTGASKVLVNSRIRQVLAKGRSFLGSLLRS